MTPQKLEILSDESIDIFFIALHGKFGEDGTLQQLMEERGLVYTGCGPEAAQLAFDKIKSKRIFRQIGIDTPDALEITSSHRLNEAKKLLPEMEGKFVVKPSREGSSIGIILAEGPADALKAAEEIFTVYGDCLIEEYIDGRELTVGILGEKPLPVIEISHGKRSYYDYNAKYIDEETAFLFETIKDKSLAENIRSTAMKCFKALQCRDLARVDIIMDNQGRICPLEVNSIPGFTSHSLLPMAAAQDGLSMEQLCIKIVESALARNN